MKTYRYTGYITAFKGAAGELCRTHACMRKIEMHISG